LSLLFFDILYEITFLEYKSIIAHILGIVLEIGSTLQHGAIIAREYGLPCACGVVNATIRIKDGDLIEVDGTNGIVKIIEEAK